MEKIKFAAQVLAIVFINILVRFHRAVDSALWEICPEMYKWTQRAIEGAHRAVCEEQRRALGKTKAPKPVKLPKAVKPVTELHSSFPSYAAQSAAIAAHKARVNDLERARDGLEYSSPEYQAIKSALDAEFKAWDRTIKTPVGVKA